ncbi:hypothetical protein C7N43_32335 [Sphingobacteriales bacterium UPWRP_1]|nr:hypothetical protein BVG80_06210 [Sphingobacteriales bacterium TSM_CSM]PSJ72801.1 hypothetical protein C7N43_32335 [Sphingobacteriales bacterium UPWRP_1]
MKVLSKTLLLFSLFLAFLFVFNACEHEPIWPEINNPNDTIPNDTIPNDTIPNDTIPNDTIPNDTLPEDTIVSPPDTTTQTGGTPCQPGVVYFENDVLPILLSNCAYSGCHNAQSHKEGVILDNYNHVMNTGEIEPFDPSESKLYKVITENDEDDIMPPPPAAPLSNDQIAIISQWILQGALNNACDENAGGCNTVNVSYSATVKPIIQNYCGGCHSGSAPLGGVLLTNYAQISAAALSGSLVGSLKGTAGYVPMPFQQPPLNQCYIDRIEAWVNDGAPYN